MDIATVATVIGAVIGSCTLLGFVIKGTNSLTRIEVTMSSLMRENDENRAFRMEADKKLNNHEHRLNSLETDVDEINDRG